MFKLYLKKINKILDDSLNKKIDDVKMNSYIKKFNIINKFIVNNPEYIFNNKFGIDNYKNNIQTGGVISETNKELITKINESITSIQKKIDLLIKENSKLKSEKEFKYNFEQILNIINGKTKVTYEEYLKIHKQIPYK